MSERESENVAPAALPSQVVSDGSARALARHLVESLESPQIQELAAALTPGQMMIVLELHRILGGDVEEDASHATIAYKVHRLVTSLTGAQKAELLGQLLDAEQTALVLEIQQLGKEIWEGKSES